MRRIILLAFLLPVFLIGCSTHHEAPIDQPQKPHAKSQDFSNLDNDQLCELSFTRVDPQIDEEIYVRDIYCDKADLTCRKQGLNRGSLAMMDCVYNEKLKNQSPNMKACLDSGVDKNDVDGMTDCLVKKEQQNNPQHIFPEQRQYIYERQ
jgi:hypothetical protein